MQVVLGTSQILHAAPCGSGTLDQLMNTTCTIGNLSFTFNNFNGFFASTDLNNNYAVAPLDPSTIRFQSMASGNLQGLTFFAGWSDAPSANQLFYSSHAASFYYTVTALNGAGIIGQSDQIVGSIGNASDTGSINSFDQQNYAVAPWCCGFITWGNVNYTNGQGYWNEPYTEVLYSDYGVEPQYASDPTNPGWYILGSGAFTTQTASLESATFLYFTQVATPEPGTLLLTLGGLAGAMGIVRRKLC
jgi:hypothetical protein